MAVNRRSVPIELLLAGRAFDPPDEIVGRLPAISIQLTDLSSRGIEQDQGWITLLINPILLRELLVLFHQLGRLFFSSWIIDLNKDQVLVRKGMKLFC